MYKRIVVANDGSEGAERALAAALVLAKRFKAELHMISVEELPRFPASVDEIVEEKNEANRHFDAIVARARALAKAQRVTLTTHVLAGHAVPTIVEFIGRLGCDLLVIGFMGHSALYNRLIGSTTDRLVELAPCTVVVVK
ncbi:MAG: universal stress protein [Alphaproteobacteria bacterium]